MSERNHFDPHYDRIVLTLTKPSWCKSERQIAVIGTMLCSMAMALRSAQTWENDRVRYFVGQFLSKGEQYIVVYVLEGLAPEPSEPEDPSIAPEELLGGSNGQA